jgi:hypothetical protein
MSLLEVKSSLPDFESLEKQDGKDEFVDLLESNKQRWIAFHSDGQLDAVSITTLWHFHSCTGDWWSSMSFSRK